MKKSMANKIMSSVQEDILFEILLRLSWRLIFQCRLVCKQWYSILSNPIFISSWMNTNNHFKPWLTVICDTTISINDFIATSSPSLYSEFFESGGMFSLHFVCSEVYPAKLFILAASNNGLVLCSTAKCRHSKYYVCNPLMKTFVLLPKPPSNKDIAILGLICTASTGYKVARIPQFSKPKTDFDTEIYSSDLGKWNRYEVSCGQQYVTMPKSLQRRCISEHNGVLYWSEGKGDRIVAFDINKIEDIIDGCSSQCKVIALPKEVKERGEHCLAEFKGSIACIHCCKDIKLSNIWVLQDDTSKGWIRRFCYPLHYVTSHIVRPLAFDSTTQSVVTLEIQAASFNAGTYNIKTKSVLTDSVSRNPKNHPDFIKAFVLTLLPTPL